MSSRRKFDPGVPRGRRFRIVLESADRSRRWPVTSGQRGAPGQLGGQGAQGGGGDDAPLGESERAELARLRAENASCACSVMSSNDPRPSGWPEAMGRPS